MLEYLTLGKFLYHFIFGFASCIFGVSLVSVLISHTIWEVFVNIELGRNFMLKYFKMDYQNHNCQETVLDNVIFTIGWIASYYYCH